MAKQRISLGFHASPPVGLQVESAEIDRIRDALQGGGWIDVATEDGRMTINLGHVLWLREDVEDTRVGFGLGA